MDSGKERMITVTDWVTGHSIKAGLPVDDPGCALVRADDLLQLLEACYNAAREALDDDFPELASLAVVVEALEDHRDRMAKAALEARGSGPRLRVVRDPDPPRGDPR